MDNSDGTTCIKAVYHTTYSNVGGCDWDIFLVTDAAGRVLRFPGEEPLVGVLQPSGWMTAEDPADSEMASRLMWTVAPLLRQLGHLTGTSWRLCWFRHGNQGASCIIQVRVPRPNALPEAIHYAARQDLASSGHRSQV